MAPALRNAVYPMRFPILIFVAFLVNWSEAKSNQKKAMEMSQVLGSSNGFRFMPWTCHRLTLENEAAEWVCKLQFDDLFTRRHHSEHIRAGWQKLAGFRRRQKMPSILSSKAYLLIVVFSCLTKITYIWACMPFKSSESLSFVWVWAKGAVLCLNFKERVWVWTKGSFIKCVNPDKS